MPSMTFMKKDALRLRRLSQNMGTLWAQWLSPKRPQKLRKVCWLTGIFGQELFYWTIFNLWNPFANNQFTVCHQENMWYFHLQHGKMLSDTVLIIVGQKRAQLCNLFWYIIILLFHIPHPTWFKFEMFLNCSVLISFDGFDPDSSQNIETEGFWISLQNLGRPFASNQFVVCHQANQWHFHLQNGKTLSNAVPWTMAWKKLNL